MKRFVIPLNLLNQFTFRQTIIAGIIMTFIFKIVYSQQCSDMALNKKHFGQRLEGFDIVTFTEDGIGNCVKKCFQLTHCLSVNFDKVSKECDLNNVTADEMTTAIGKSHKSVLSDLSTWPRAMVGSCGDKLCHGRDICMPAGNTFLCHNSDCPKAPLFSKTTSTGSLEIGGRMVYKCTQRLHHVIGKDFVQCGWMNTWSSIDEITCTAVQCPDDWTRYNDSCYLLGDGNGMNFMEAVNYCEGLGAEIVQIESADENLFVTDNLLRNLGNHYWLGLTDEEEGVWRWYKTGELATYFDWISGDPGGAIDEDCVVINVNWGYKWSDVRCTPNYLPFCELRLSV